MSEQRVSPWRLTPAFIALVLLLVLPLLGTQSACAAIEALPFATPELQTRYQALTDELRCPKCQNQNLADSNSPIAGDLRREVYRMLNEGKTDNEIKDFMVERYGEFVLYRPLVHANTVMLWSGPAVFFLLGIAVLIMLQRRRRVLPVTTAPLTEVQQQLLRELHGRAP